MKKLERQLGLTQVISVSVSSMLGSGIFILPGLAVSMTGSHLWLAYLLSAFFVLPAAFSKSELSTAMPTAGGTYVYIEKTFGPLAGAISGMGLWLSLLFKSAFALIGFGSYLTILIDLDIRFVSISMLIGIVLLNIFGVGKVAKVLTIVVVVCLFFFTLLVLGSIPQTNLDHFSSLSDISSSGILSGAAFVFLSFAGVTKAAAVAEEVKNPSRNLPLGILISLGIVALAYAALSYSIVAVLSVDGLRGDLRSVYSLADKVGGPYLSLTIASVAIITMSSMANAGLLAASRFPFAMSRDGIIPPLFTHISSRFLTPIPSIMISGLIMGVAILCFDITGIAKLASAVIISVFLWVNLCVLVLRETRVQWYKPTYKSPLYPWAQIFGILSALGLLTTLGNYVVLSLGSITTIGTLVYLCYSRKNTSRRGVLGIRLRRSNLGETHLNDLGNTSPSMRHLERLKVETDASVIVLLFGRERAPEALIEEGIALSQKGLLEVIHLTEAPDQTDLDDFDIESPEQRSLRRRVEALSKKHDQKIAYEAIVSHDLIATVFELASRFHCQWIINEWRGKSRQSLTFHRPVGWLEDHMPCRLITIRDKGVRTVSKIAAIVKGGKGDMFVIETAKLAAQFHQAEIEIILVLKKKQKNDSRQFNLISNVEALGRFHSLSKITILYCNKTSRALGQLSVDYDLMILEQRTKSILSRLFGNEGDRITGRSAANVMLVRAPKKS